MAVWDIIDGILGKKYWWRIVITLRQKDHEVGHAIVREEISKVEIPPAKIGLRLHYYDKFDMESIDVYFPKIMSKKQFNIFKAEFDKLEANITKRLSEKGVEFDYDILIIADDQYAPRDSENREKVKS